MPLCRWVWLLGVVAPVGLTASAQGSDWGAALTFYASFDEGVDAVFSEGDAAIYTLINPSEKTLKAGLPEGGATALLKEGGRLGGCLDFQDADADWILYRAENNLKYRESDWQGTVSIWLRCDPVDGLAPGYCDPIQITPRQWNDAAFFIDFNKEGSPRDFRLGAFSDLELWNPENVDVPEPERPLVTAQEPGFSPDQWTHVAFTWEGYNNGTTEALTRFYIDGELNGTLKGWEQQFTWAADERSAIMLGLHYIGQLDELACFNRALDAEEIRALYAKPESVAEGVK